MQAVTDDAKVNAAVAAEAERRADLCVRADDADVVAGRGRPRPAARATSTVGVLGGGDPRRAAGIRDAVVDGLRDGTLDAAALAGASPPASPWSAAAPATPG